MSLTKTSGVIPPVVIPLKSDRSLDVESLARSINRMISAGVDGLFILGSSSEVVFSTDARRRSIIENSVRIVAHRVPVLCGIIDTESERVIAHGKTAESLGVDALVATCPFYALGGEDEIERHFRLLHERLDLPIFAYDIPICVHTKLDSELLVRLGRDGAIAGVKDSSGDDSAFRILCILNKEVGHPMSLLTGHEVVVDGAYLSGADGSVPGLANVDPKGYVRQWRHAQAGDWEACAREQDRLAKLMRITSVTTGVKGFGAGVGAFKTALKLLGVFTSNMMPNPVEPLKDENVEAVRTVLVDSGLLEG